MSKPKVRTRWDRDRSPAFLISNPHPGSKTQQQFKDECDMNRIVKNAMKGVQPRWLAQGVPQYGDFSGTRDLLEAREVIERAMDGFMALPAELRAELGNDPMRFPEITEDQAARYKLLKNNPPPKEDSVPPAVAGGAPKAPSKGKAPAPATPPPGEE